jgi:hypothetical protein
MQNQTRNLVIVALLAALAVVTASGTTMSSAATPAMTSCTARISTISGKEGPASAMAAIPMTVERVAKLKDRIHLITNCQFACFPFHVCHDGWRL